MTYPQTALFIGFALAVLILWLIRRDRLHLSAAIFWLAVAAGAIVFALLPRVVDVIGGWVGVAYPPAFLLGVLVVVLLVKALLADLALAALRRDLRRLGQQVALAELDARNAVSRSIETPFEG